MLRLKKSTVEVVQPDKNMYKNIALCWIGKIDAEKNIVTRKKKNLTVHYFLFAKQSKFRVYDNCF